MKLPKLRTIKQIKKNCEKLYKQIILLRDVCCQWQACCKGAPGVLQTHHIIKRSKSRLLFYDLLNLVLLCSKCHTKYTNDETAGVRWFSEKFRVRWEYLHAPVVNESGVKMPRRNIVKSSWHKSDFEEIEIMLKEKLADLGE